MGIGVEEVDGSDKQAAIRVARNQALFRSVNEQIEIADKTFSVILNERVDFVCECADHTCNRITVTLAQYEALGRFPTHVIVKAGHVYREFRTDRRRDRWLRDRGEVR